MSVSRVSARSTIVRSDGQPSRHGQRLLADMERKADDNTTALEAEIADRQSADTTLQTNLNAEATTRANADTALQGEIDTEETARANAVAALQAEVDAVEAILGALTGVLTATAALDFPSIPAQSSAELTITVTGAAAGNAVVLGPPAVVAAHITFAAYVSAADTVTVRAVNATASAVDPPSGTFRAVVMKF